MRATQLITSALLILRAIVRNAAEEVALSSEIVRSQLLTPLQDNADIAKDGLPVNSLFLQDKFVTELLTNDDLTDVLKHLHYVNALPGKRNAVHTKVFERRANEAAKKYGLQATDTTYAVMYYADWCPHCHRMAPLWKRLAFLFHCTPGIRFFAFECSQNLAIRVGHDKIRPLRACLDQGIRGFPALFLYWAQSKADNLPHLQIPLDAVLGDTAAAPGNSADGFDDQVYAAVDFNVSRDRDNLDWNSLGWTAVDADLNITGGNSVTESSIRVNSLVTLDNISDDTMKYQQGNSLDTQIIRYYNEPKERSIAALRAWVLLHAPIYNVAHCVPDNAVIGTIPMVKGLELHDSLISQAIEVKDRWDARHEPSPDMLLYEALEGFFYVLCNWVVDTNKVITPARMHVVLQLIEIAAALFPGQNIQSTLQDLAAQLTAACQIESQDGALSNDAYFEIINRLEFAGLRASELAARSARSQTISGLLWEFWHFMSVAYYVKLENNLHLPISYSSKAASGDRDMLQAWDIALAMRNSVDQFFRCDICRMHFLAFFDNCYADLCLWVRDQRFPKELVRVIGKKDGSESNLRYSTPTNATSVPLQGAAGFIVWLWRFHNAVTFRTATERTADVLLASDGGVGPSYAGKDVRFPPSGSVCPQCRLSGAARTVALNSTGTKEEDLILSDKLLDEMASWERMALGELGPDENPEPVAEDTWDQYADFDLSEVQAFLVRRFFKTSWLDPDVVLQWNTLTSTFEEKKVGNVHTEVRQAAASAPISIVASRVFLLATILIIPGASLLTLCAIKYSRNNGAGFLIPRRLFKARHTSPATIHSDVELGDAIHVPGRAGELSNTNVSRHTTVPSHE